jgi:hypothetical protein
MRRLGGLAFIIGRDRRCDGIEVKSKGSVAESLLIKTQPAPPAFVRFLPSASLKRGTNFR